MKKTLIRSLLALTLLTSSSVFAHGWGGGRFWGGMAAGAVVGGVIASNYYHPYYAPAYVQPVYAPQPIYVQPQYSAPQAQYPGQPQAYFCGAYNAYYPQVQQCPSGWQIIH